MTGTMLRCTRLLLPLLLGAGACAPCDGTAAAAEELRQTQPSHVDSMFSIAENIRRFRSALPDSAGAFTDGAASREELVGLYLAALRRRDYAALTAMALSPAEFVYLYYPHTRFVAPPYELSPQLVWFQLETYGSRGLQRAVLGFGGRDTGYRGHSCGREEVQGPNRLVSGCVLRLDDGAGGTMVLSLFGHVVERDGVWKLVSHANGL